MLLSRCSYFCGVKI